MSRMTIFAGALLLLSFVDVSQIYSLRPSPIEPSPAQLPALSTPPDIFLTIVRASLDKKSAMEPQTELAIVRYVDGEFARVVRPLPSVKHGFTIEVGHPLDEEALKRALLEGSAANPGDQVQITNIEFRSKQIVVSINGGTKKHFDWRRHIQIGMGPMPTMQTVQAPVDRGPTGAVLILDFGHALPEVSPAQVKHYLSPFLDFAGQRSSAVNWVETLPPAFQKAIKERTAVPGMDRDMVTAAMGRPDQKVRERDVNGNEFEDWIYGQPPGKTVFVTFSGKKVVRVKTYNRGPSQ